MFRVEHNLRLKILFTLLTSRRICLEFGSVNISKAQKEILCICSVLN